jgi:hypothetical protein
MSTALIVVAAAAPGQAQAPAQPAATQPTSPKVDSPAVDRSSSGIWPVSPLWLDVTGQSNERILSSITPSGPWRIYFGPQNGCPTCDATRLQPPTNANAPWALKAGVSYVGTDAEVTLGVIGYRNYRLPLYPSQPFRANYDLTPPVSSFADMADNRTQWLLSAAVRKTIKRMSEGQTIGIGVDAFVPISWDGAAPGAPDTRALPSKALRLNAVRVF